MHRGTGRCSAYLLLLNLALALAVRGDAQPGVPGSTPPAMPEPVNPLVDLLPSLRSAPAPPWVKEKLRVTYYSAVATIPRERYYTYRTPSGALVEADEVGPAGHSYMHCDVVALDAKAAVTAIGLYAIDPTTGQIRPSTQLAHVGVPGAGSAWADPATLAGAEGIAREGLKVVTMPYPLGGKTWRSIRFDYTSQNGHTAMVYDLDTGLLIHYNHAVESADHRHVQLATMQYKGQRLLTIPWAGQAAPEWVAPGANYRLQGTFSSVMPGAPTVPLAAAQTIEVLDTGPKWTTLKVVYWINNAAAETRRVVTGVAQLLRAYWLPMQGLGTLQAGQVIDKETLTGATVSVHMVEDDFVVLCEEGPEYRVLMAYSKQNGGLLGIQETFKIGTAVNQLELQIGD